MNLSKKILTTASVFLASAFLLVGSASAHVTVKPGEVLVDTYQVFTISVPNEKDNPTVSVRLEVPESIGSITPTSVADWTISFEATREGDDRRVQAVTWSGGSIPANQRGEFSFSAKTPAETTTITWKAYQTYADGTTVSWDQTDTDEHGHDGGNLGLASLTTVTEPGAEIDQTDDANTWARYALYVSIVSFAVALTALYLAMRKRA